MAEAGNCFYCFGILKDISSFGRVKYIIFMAIAMGISNLQTK